MTVITIAYLNLYAQKVTLLVTPHNTKSISMATIRNIVWLLNEGCYYVKEGTKPL